MSAAVLWLYLCALIAGLAAARCCAAALFLRSHTPRSLGGLYMVVALVVTATLCLFAKLDGRISQQRIAWATILAVSLGAIFFAHGGAGVHAAVAKATTEPQGPSSTRLQPPSHGTLFYGALYVFVETSAVITTLQFWTLANTFFSWPQAQRWYPFLASGGIVGGMTGGWLAQQLSSHDPLSLLWLLVLVGPVVAAAIYIVARCRPAGEGAGAGTGQAGMQVPRFAGGDLCPLPRLPVPLPAPRPRSWSALSSTLSWVIFLTVFTTTLTDFYFKFFADRQYGDSAAGLTRFFGNYYVAVGLTTLGLQVLLTPLLVRRANAFAGLTLLPLALLAGAAANFATPTLMLALLLKLLDSGFSHSVYRSCRELLFTPLPVELVGSFKTLSEGVAGRLGLLASGVVLFVTASARGERPVLLLIAASALVWLLAVWRLWRAYRSEIPEIWEAASDAPAGPEPNLLRPPVLGG